MKKTTQIAAGIALALMAGGASASLSLPVDGDGNGTTSSIVFAAVDTNSANTGNYLRTFYYDLALGDAGLNSRSFAAKTQGTDGTLTWNLANIAQFAGYTGDTSSLKWTVTGGEAYDYTNGSTWGALSTGVVTGDFTNTPGTANNALTGSGSIVGWFNAINNAGGTAAGDNVGTNVGDLAKTSTTTSFFGDYYSDLGDLAGTLPHGPFVNGIGSDNFFRITNPTFSGKNTIPNLGTFSLSASNVLTFQAANVAAEPLPAAVWFFLSGLMGFMGLNRRKAFKA